MAAPDSDLIVARREVQKLGYRVCLDGLTSLNIAQVNREKLGVDLLKLQWNSDDTADLQISDLAFPATTSAKELVRYPSAVRRGPGAPARARPAPRTTAAAARSSGRIRARTSSACPAR